MATLKSPTKPTFGSHSSNDSSSFKAGDFTGLVCEYSQHRPDYYSSILKSLFVLLVKPDFNVDFVDVSAGTGILNPMAHAA
jgi:hypothetical protein